MTHPSYQCNAIKGNCKTLIQCKDFYNWEYNCIDEGSGFFLVCLQSVSLSHWEITCKVVWLQVGGGFEWRMELLNITEIHGHLSHSGTGVWLDIVTHGIMEAPEQTTTANSVNQTSWHQIELDQSWTNAN